MDKSDLRDVWTFAIIAEERSFTRAAARLGVSTSALSHQLQSFEQRLGIQLLHRSTRSVAPTEAGAFLLRRVGPGLHEVTTGFEAINEWRESPAGMVRITSNRWAAERLIAPSLSTLRHDHPSIVVELSIDDRVTDIIGEGFDLGVRPGTLISQDMVARRLEPDDTSVIVGAPSYLERHSPPKSPEALREHRCLLYRQIHSRRLLPWRLVRRGKTVSVLTEPTFITDDPDLLVARALAGDGLAYLRREQVREDLASGALVEVLADWAAPLAGNHLYYASRRVLSPAIRLVIDVLTGAKRPTTVSGKKGLGR